MAHTTSSFTLVAHKLMEKLTVGTPVWWQQTEGGGGGNGRRPNRKTLHPAIITKLGPARVQLETFYRWNLQDPRRTTWVHPENVLPLALTALEVCLVFTDGQKDSNGRQPVQAVYNGPIPYDERYECIGVYARNEDGTARHLYDGTSEQVFDYIEGWRTFFLRVGVEHRVPVISYLPSWVPSKLEGEWWILVSIDGKAYAEFACGDPRLCFCAVALPARVQQLPTQFQLQLRQLLK